jgi:hypothetical protein
MDEKLDNKLYDKFNNFIKELDEQLMNMSTQGLLEENHWTTQHIEPH